MSDTYNKIPYTDNEISMQGETDVLKLLKEIEAKNTGFSFSIGEGIREITRLRQENERLRDALSSIVDIIEAVDHRAMFSAIIPPTLKEMTQEEMSDIYALSKGHPKGWRP